MVTTRAREIALDDLRAIVGAEHARTAEGADAVAGVAPRFVVEPGSIDEASAVLRLANEATRAVAPRGGGSKMNGGNPPSAVDLIVSTARLDRVLEHAAGDLVVSIEAGATLHRVQSVLASAGQMLALDPPESGATIGGIIATDASGPRRLRYGTVRDLLIGVTVVLADGTVARAGGKVVKNVAGYDLAKLFTGSQGTLGLIVEAIFRLHPLPSARRVVVLDVHQYDAVGAAVQAILQSHLTPSAIEIQWQRGGVLSVLFEGVEPGVIAQAETTRDRLQALGPARVLAGDEADIAWQRASVSPGSGVTGARLKIATVPTALPDLLEHIDTQTSARVSGHAGSGVLFVDLADADAEALPRIVAALRARVDGSVVVLQQPPSAAERVDAWGAAGDALGLMRRVKERYDPRGIMNPGRFVGGI